jgi:hypothetical protein
MNVTVTSKMSHANHKTQKHTLLFTRMNYLCQSSFLKDNNIFANFDPISYYSSPLAHWLNRN